ncbi:transcriptional regulator, SARP family [Coriobacterium glomerans PW2]|uniref:Transcriptional regulator, SARP family n=1 Tax=Coriobacterium glomerans (strain ATCC 49209 / DSM 20642 / JCM 10262 / PW2) TaxID=700015 RepID=F2NAR7_CORGP|nr:BTAD domain-containing putative transcriptional regulator [Coriobacterium glomerans]AEB07523.1 transcriptional regulator, SARP family [Coriobacterium glomerans PW2]
MRNNEPVAKKDVNKKEDCSPKSAALPMGTSFMVARTHLVRDLISRGSEAGIVLICAPHGFGKTGLLLQYADEVRSDPARGAVSIMDVTGFSLEELDALLDRGEELIALSPHPLLAIDNAPCLDPPALKAFVEHLRKMRERGFEFIITCRPNNHALVRATGDSIKVSAQSLKVRPKEYAEWARTFSISSSLDVYRLTQGVPLLVASLQTVTERQEESETMLDLAVIDIYRSVLNEIQGDCGGLADLIQLMLLMGQGSIADMERCGVRVDVRDLSRIARDYPLFGFDPASREFSCINAEGSSLRRICEQIAAMRPELVTRAARILLKADRVDRAAMLIDQHLDAERGLAILQQFPLKLALAGHATLISAIVARYEALPGQREIGVGALLGAYAAALTSGDIALARLTARELSRRAQRIDDEIDSADWEAACALSEMWTGCRNIELPQSPRFAAESPSLPVVARLRAHVRFQSDFLRGRLDPADPGRVPTGASEADDLDVSSLLDLTDLLLGEVASGTLDKLDERDQLLCAMEPIVRSRRLRPLLDRLRLVVSARRMLVGLPVTDERSFADASTGAIRAGDQSTQLLCLLLEGWQDLMVGQVVNAEFRGTQVLRLADKEQKLLRSWAHLLERTAHVMNTSRVAIREEAEMLDLAENDISVAQAWANALLLSSARFDAELSAWYSLHKNKLLDPGMRLIARLAMCALGERADAMRRLIPDQLRRRYDLQNDSEPKGADPLLGVPDPSITHEVGQLNIRLFGGFKAERNGHTLTDELWRRRKTSVLASRLVLGMGSFVSRRTLAEELWPEYDYGHARSNLYSALSMLRRAMGQRRGGPQYIITQGEGVAVNSEYVASDVMRMALLTREVLLGRSGVSGEQILEMCLKIEELYVGPLYVPDAADSAYFVRVRKAMGSRFLDCMIRGVEIAIEQEDFSSAAWMIEAALKEDRTREDVIRSAMRVYDLGGRRREAVELYQSHLYYLDHELKASPESETCAIYERIVRKSRNRDIM